MEKLLLVTGRLAENEVRAAAKRIGADFLVLPVSVAQFMSTRLAAGEIKRLKINYDKIILPGLVRFDASELEKEIGIPCFKGPKQLSDLPGLFNKGTLFSGNNQPDKDGKAELARSLSAAEKKKAVFSIGKLKIGPAHPPRIIAEIVDAPPLSDKAVLERTEYYLKSGADIIDVGAIAGEDNSQRLAEIVHMLKKSVDAPISIDSLNPAEINACIDAGVDLVLSLCASNLSAVKNSDDTTYVFIPDEESALDGIIEKAQAMGFKKLIADPILHPPFRIAESLCDYTLFRKSGDLPLLMGASNVVELMDMDSIGINGLLAALATELAVSLVLITENSEKTRGSVREMRRALDMCFLAKEKGALPKDLAINLLLAKAKNKGDPFELPDIEVISAEPKGDFIPDPEGHFRISVDFDKNMIVAVHYKGKCRHLIQGESAESVSKSIIEKGIISRMDHAAYLGRELQKAEECLRLKKGYFQDECFKGL